MGKMPDLKPCQADAKAKIGWRDSWHERDCVCVVGCPKYEHHTAMVVGREFMDDTVQQYAERELMYNLCKGCKEVNKNDDEK